MPWSWSQIGHDGYVMIVSPHKTAGSFASIGHIAPGVMNVFTDGWEPLKQNGTSVTRRIVLRA